MGKHPSDEHLSSFIDGDMGERKRRRTAEHLSGCAACRARLAQLESIRTWAETLKPVEVPPELFAGVRARIAARTPARSPARWIAVAALGALLAFAAVLPHAVERVLPSRRAAFEPSTEPLGPPVGLARAQGFKADTVPLEPERGVGLETVAYQSPDSQRVVLIPLDETARRNMGLPGLAFPHWETTPWLRPQPVEDCVVVVRETIPR